MQPLRQRVTWLCCILTVLMSTAALQAQISEARRLYIAGKEALEGGDSEIAAPLLARGLVIAKKSRYSRAKSEMMSQIPKLLRKADPYYGSGIGARREAAKALIRIAQLYEKHKWLRTAFRILQKAADFDEKLATAKLKKMRKRLQTDSKGVATAKSATNITEFFKSGEQLSELKGWKIEGDTITAPKPRRTMEAIIVTKQEIIGEFRLELEVNTMNSRGGFGIVLHFKNLRDYIGLTVKHERKWTEISLDRIKGEDYESLREWTTRFPSSEREEWMPVIIEVSKTRLGFKIGKLHMRYIPRPSLVEGKIGLRISPSHPGKSAPMFRKIEIHRL